MEETKKDEKQSKQGKSIVLNVVGIVLCVVFIPIIIINLVLIVRSYAEPDKIPSVFGVSPIIVLSGSMSPEFEAGDLIFVQKTDPYTLQQGDVICYIAADDASAVTHRIIEIQQQDGGPVFITRGDANNVEDRTPVKPEEVQGKYMNFYLSGVGNFAVFMQSTVGMIVFIVCPLVLFLLWDVARRALASRKKAGQVQARVQETEELQKELERLRAQVEKAQIGEEVSAPPSADKKVDGSPGGGPSEEESSFRE